MFWITIAVNVAQADGIVGLDWVPTGRAELVAAGETSGTGLSEFDGVLRPPMTAWAGWTHGQTAVLWGLSVGWTRTASYIGDSKTVSARGGVRPSVDVRRALSEGVVSPWLQAGVYGTVPWAREVSTLYSTEEAAAMATEASADRGRIAGYGVRIGGGAEGALGDAMRIGVRWLMVAHQGNVGTEDGRVISTRLFPETALTVRWML
jgi:hypothetical protein